MSAAFKLILIGLALVVTGFSVYFLGLITSDLTVAGSIADFDFYPIVDHFTIQSDQPITLEANSCRKFTLQGSSSGPLIAIKNEEPTLGWHCPNVSPIEQWTIAPTPVQPGEMWTGSSEDITFVRLASNDPNMIVNVIYENDFKRNITLLFAALLLPIWVIALGTIISDLRKKDKKLTTQQS